MMRISLFRNIFRRSRIVKWFEYNPVRKDWSAAAVDHSRCGSHRDYNIIANSVCDGIYFASKTKANRWISAKIDLYKHDLIQMIHIKN